MNPDWTTEQDKEFERDMDNSGLLLPVQKEIVLNYIHHREALLIERVVGEMKKGMSEIPILTTKWADGEDTQVVPLNRVLALQDLLANEKI